MNAKLLFKTIFMMLVVLVLVMIGMNNRSNIPFSLPPIIGTIKQPAAIMYVGFFAFGFIAGTILTAGGGKKGGSAAPKPAKSSR